MWARHVELAMAVWLGISPFVFQHEPGQTFLWVNDFACAAAVTTFALASHWRRTRRAHLLSLAVAAWLALSGLLTVWSLGEVPAYQNHLVVGVLLGMFAIIPSEASRPTTSWRRYYLEERTGPAGPEVDEVEPRRSRAEAGTTSRA